VKGPASTRDHRGAVAPFFCLVRAAWIPYALTWEPETGAIRSAEGPRAFASYREAVEASRFLVVPGQRGME
jgi:hypothetical protein